MVPQIRRFTGRIKKFFRIVIMGFLKVIEAWGTSEEIPDDVKSITESLNRFISFIKKANREENLASLKDKKIDFIPLFEQELYNQQESIWNSFLNKLQNNINNNGGELFNGINAILFYTTEEIPRGDFPDSVYNKSRMLRNFFENTSFAKTANYRNIVEKLKELIIEIENKDKLSEKKKDLTKAVKNLNSLFISAPFNSSLEDLSKIYTYQSFHTLPTHQTLRDFGSSVENFKIASIQDVYKNFKSNSIQSNDSIIEEFIKFIENQNLDIIDNESSKKIALFKDEYFIKRQKHDIASIISVNPLRFTRLKILVIDDNEDIAKDLKKIIPFLPNESEIYLTASSEYKKFIYLSDFIQNLYKCEGELIVKKITTESNEIKQLSNNGKLFNNGKFDFDYIIVDLLLGNYNEGNKIIRQLVKLRDYLGYEKASFFILALSLSEDVDDISRSFEEGALGYVWKFNRIYQLPYLIAELEESRRQIEQGIGIAISHAKARNFEKLYHLPPRIQMKLRTEPILPIAFNDKNVFHPFAKDIARNLIKQFPKADLHYHLGGSMDDNIVFYLAVNSLCHIYNEIGGEDKIKEIIKDICNVLKKVKPKRNSEFDFYEAFFESNKNKIYAQMISIKNGKIKKRTDFLNFLISQFGRLDRIKSYIEKNFDKPAEVYFDYLSWKHKLNKDDIITIFIVIVGLIEGKTINEAKKFWDELKKKIDKITSDEILKSYFSQKHENFNPPILNDDSCSGNINEYCENFENIKKELSKYNLLSSLIEAPEDAKSLKEMFRGDCFTGALHLQYYENIIACVWYLVEKSAEENIRYLEMKASPSGYTKKGLTLHQSVQALTDGADLSSLYLYIFQHKFIWTNFILTLKRHKTPYERVQEIASAIMFRETELEKLRPQIKVLNSPHTTPYEWQPSKVVAVDLAGYEKGYLPSDFLDEFSAIFQVCSYITIHAGEEESAQAIWEAIYKLHANRIGHGLTIHEFKDLMNLARDTQICLELCPTSNVMTNFRGNPEKYPLFKYMKEGLNVTINTDDRGTLGTTLSDEFVKSAELYYISDDNSKRIPLTKWETLRLIKAGFDNAFINREEKRKLLRWVEEEIYEKILQLYEIEPIYPVDKITESVEDETKTTNT
jgi:adenosine deaminase/CheY-like chemotaxis protein